MYKFIKRWERFYTDAKQQSKESLLVDQIAIDVNNKVYFVCEDADIMITDGYDEYDNEICSFYVSREIFDIILNGLKAKGYVETEMEEQ